MYDVDDNRIPFLISTTGNSYFGGVTGAINSSHFQYASEFADTSAAIVGFFNAASGNNTSTDRTLALNIGCMGSSGGTNDYHPTGMVIASINFLGQANDATYAGGGIDMLVQSGGNIGRASVGTAMLFRTMGTSSTGGTEKMRIDETGAVMFNTTTRTATGVGGATFDPNSVGRAVLNLGSVNYTSEVDLVRLYNNNGEVGDIRTNGSGASFNSNSDYRLKENEVTLPNALTRLNNLKPYRFNFKADPSTTLDGFFAHEVQEVVPEAVTGTKDQMMPIQYKEGDEIPEGKQVYDVKEYSTTEIDAQKMDASKLVPLLVKAVQELSAKVKELENA